MAGAVDTGRTTAAGDDDVVVFLIGVRVHAWHRPQDWLGLLSARSYLSGRVVLVVQYWRSFAALEAYARAADREHLPAWRAFPRRARSGRVGIFHETYVVPAGSRETVYVQMPPFGLGLAHGTERVGTPTERAAQRLSRRARAGGGARPQTPGRSAG